MKMSYGSTANGMDCPPYMIFGYHDNPPIIILPKDQELELNQSQIDFVFENWKYFLYATSFSWISFDFSNLEYFQFISQGKAFYGKHLDHEYGVEPFNS